MKQPFFKVYIDNDSGRDISGYIDDFQYEDCTEKDSMLRITVKNEAAFELTDDSDFENGKILAFQFGFLSSVVSEIHRCEITDIKHSFGKVTTMTLICLDLGTKIKKVESQKIWKGLTSYQIAEQIAAKYNLDFQGDETDRVWGSIPQSNRSDLDFLRYLAARESKGNMISFVRNTTLYFQNRGTERDSIMTFTFKDGDGVVESFRPSTRESTGDSSTVRVSTTAVDPEVTKREFDANGNRLNFEADTDTEDKTGTLGKYNPILYGNPYLNVVRLRKHLNIPAQDPEEIKAVANNVHKKSKLKNTEAQLVIEGSPLITPNNIITMSGLPIKYLGNWLIVKAKHNIQNGSYKTTLELLKNGSTKGVKASDSNTSKGGKSIDDKVKLRVFNSDGIFLRFSSGEGNAKIK